MKRQKERVRQERQAEKARKRAEKKSQEGTPPPAPAGPRDPVVTYDEEGQPQGLGFHDF